MTNGKLQSYSGDPGVNSNYFSWNQPIRVALTGTVRYVVSDQPDNNGNLGDNNQGNNEIIVEHANGIFTRYAHMRQNSTTVRVGQLVHAGTAIARVDNAGSSSKPHLHFHAFKIDASGRQVAAPVSITGMKMDQRHCACGCSEGWEPLRDTVSSAGVCVAPNVQRGVALCEVHSVVRRRMSLTHKPSVRRASAEKLGLQVEAGFGIARAAGQDDRECDLL